MQGSRSGGPPGPYLCAPQFEHGALRSIAELPELQADPDLLATLSAVGLRTCSFMTQEEMLAAGVGSARRTLEECEIDPGAVDVILFPSTCYFQGRTQNDPDAPGAILQHLVEALGLRSAVPYGTSFSRCVNIVSAIELARGLVTCGRAKTILVLTADRVGEQFPRIVPPGIGVVSDVASSFVISDSPRAARSYRIEETCQSVDWALASITPEEDFPEFLRRTTGGMRSVATRMYELRGRSASGYEQLITNTVNISVLRVFSNATSIPTSRIYAHHIGTLGHCDVADLIVNLTQYSRSDRATTHVLAVANGPYMWGAVSLERQ